MPTETVTTNERVTSVVTPETVRSREDEALRERARRHVERVRKFRTHLTIYLLAMLVLTPVWVVTQYETADGWPKHLSTRSRYPGDWDPWIIWAGLIGAVLVAFSAYRAYVDRGDTEAEIEREVERLKATR